MDQGSRIKAGLWGKIGKDLEMKWRNENGRGEKRGGRKKVTGKKKKRFGTVGGYKVSKGKGMSRKREIF